MQGQGLPQDAVEAVRWYRLAAAQGNARAQFNLGVMCVGGEGIPQDYREAVRWYRLAAEQGLVQAQTNLGFMFATGRGVPQDYIQAHMWLSLAASRVTGENRERAVKGRDLGASRMTSEEISEAQRLTREWDAAHPREPSR